MSNAEDAINEALRRMYDEAEPGLDWDEVRENPEEQDEDWFKEHELPREREREIISDIEDEYNLTGHEKTKLTMTAVLNYGPSYPDDE